MAKAIVVSDATGAIVRTLRGDPTLLALQLGRGESLFVVLEGQDSGSIDDSKVVVSETGNLIEAPGVTLDYDLPDITLHYVPT